MLYALNADPEIACPRQGTQICYETSLNLHKGAIRGSYKGNIFSLESVLLGRPNEWNYAVNKNVLLVTRASRVSHELPRPRSRKGRKGRPAGVSDSLPAVGGRARSRLAEVW